LGQHETGKEFITQVPGTLLVFIQMAWSQPLSLWHNEAISYLPRKEFTGYPVSYLAWLLRQHYVVVIPKEPKEPR